MLQKANADPTILPKKASKAPGHIPKVNPIMVREVAKPNKGGCDVATVENERRSNVSVRDKAFEYRNEDVLAANTISNAPNEPWSRSHPDRSWKN